MTTVSILKSHTACSAVFTHGLPVPELHSGFLLFVTRHVSSYKQHDQGLLWESSTAVDLYLVFVGSEMDSK
ncbi:unnamed protein product [Boreogadus saida]